jgi:hypothetical protein
MKKIRGERGKQEGWKEQEMRDRKRKGQKEREREKGKQIRKEWSVSLLFPYMY